MNAWKYYGLADSEIVSQLKAGAPIFRGWQPYNVEECIDDVRDDPDFIPLFYNCISPLENLQNVGIQFNTNMN